MRKRIRDWLSKRQKKQLNNERKEEKRYDIIIAGYEQTALHQIGENSVNPIKHSVILLFFGVKTPFAARFFRHRVIPALPAKRIAAQ